MIGARMRREDRMKSIHASVGVLLLLTGCAAPVSGVSDGRTSVEPTCALEVGMSEQKFRECACHAPPLNLKASTFLISAQEVGGKIEKVYACGGPSRGAHLMVKVVDGVVTDLNARR